MTSFVKVTLEMIEDDVSSTIDELLSSKIKKVVSKSLVELGGKIARNAKTKQILSGGSKSVVNSKRLTGRTNGAGGLVGSISDILQARQDSILVGSNLEYAGVHEYGFEEEVTVKSHQRTIAFGKKVSPFTVPSHKRKMKIPKRPYLTPALDAEIGSWQNVFAKHWQMELNK